MLYFADTSALLNKCAKDYDKIWISPLIVSELENIKTSSSKDEHTKYLARQLVRDILFNIKYESFNPSQRKIDSFIKHHPTLSNINDHRILAAAHLLQEQTGENITFLTSDGSLYLLAWSVGIETIYYQPKEEKKEEYCGWNKFTPNEEQLISLYTDPTINILNANINEYCEIFENDELKDVLRWTGEKYVSLKYQNFTSILGEKIRPRNLEQKMYLDLLQNKEIPVKMCIGHFGTGKSKLALDYALNELKSGRFDKIVFVKNNLEVKGAGVLGTLPGDEINKQYPWLRQIEDHIGIQKFEEYLESGMIEPAHLSSLRGRDLRSSCVVVDEAENLLDKNIQLLLGRVAEGSEIIFCADVKQCDYKDEKMSGIPKAIERLKGNKLFGLVKLIKTERSNVAALADLLD